MKQILPVMMIASVLALTACKKEETPVVPQEQKEAVEKKLEATEKPVEEQKEKSDTKVPEAKESSQEASQKASEPSK